MSVQVQPEPDPQHLHICCIHIIFLQAEQKVCHEVALSSSTMEVCNFMATVTDNWAILQVLPCALACVPKCMTRAICLHKYAQRVSCVKHATHSYSAAASRNHLQNQLRSPLRFCVCNEMEPYCPVSELELKPFVLACA